MHMSERKNTIMEGTDSIRGMGDEGDGRGEGWEEGEEEEREGRRWGRRRERGEK